MLNLIYFRYHHWITISLLIRDSLVSANDSGLFVTHRSVGGKLKELGLKHKKDFVFTDELLIFLKDNSFDFNFVIHHNDYSMDLYKTLYLEAPEIFYNSKISFYADGYTNKFLKPELGKKLLNGLRNVKPGYFITFDNRQDTLPDHLEGFSSLTCNSSRFEVIFDNIFFNDAVLNAYNFYKNKFKTNKLALLLLRPWGSDKFQNGFFHSSSSSLSKVVSEMLISQYGSESYDLLIRADNRDSDYMKFVIDELNQQLGNNVNILTLDTNWVDWLTMDSFLHLFPKLTDINIDLYVLDSTAASPFINSGNFKNIYIGAPENKLLELFEGNATFTQIDTKINSLKRMYHQILSESGSRKSLITIDGTFFSVSFND